MSHAEDIFNDIKNRGIEAINDFIENSASEEYFLDFKRVTQDGISKYLDESEKRNFSKAISGFGNTEGGVIVWGVDCRPDSAGRDIAGPLYPINDPRRFKSLLDSNVSGRTLPQHTSVENFVVFAKDLEEKGYVVSLIPKSDAAPHQSLYDQKYYMRTGSSFSPMLHGLIEGMFGRRPHPNLELSLRKAYIKKHGEDYILSANAAIRNVSSVVAKDVYLSLIENQSCGPNCKFQFLDTNERYSTFGASSHEQISSILLSKNKLPPQARSIPFSFRLCLQPPFQRDLVFTFVFGCGRMMPVHSEKILTRDILERFYNNYEHRILTLSMEKIIEEIFNMKISIDPNKMGQ